MLANPSGATFTAYNGFIVDAFTVTSKEFLISDSMALGTEIVSWNGLVQSSSTYKIQNGKVIFNFDTPLTIGDEIGIKYFLGD